MDHHSLLTQDAKTARIKKLLPHNTHTGQFFIPDDLFYVAPRDNNGLRAQARQLAMWIGFKPSGLDIRFSADLDMDGCFINDNGNPKILIHSRYAHNPYASAALLAECMLSYYLVHRKKIKLVDEGEQETLILLAVVYSGLGLVALNRVTSYWQEHYPRLYSIINRIGKKNSSLSYYPNYVGQYAKKYGLEISSYSKYLCPWALDKMRIKRPASSNTASYVKSTLSRSRRAYIVLFVSVLITTGGLSLTNHIIRSRPATLSASLIRQKEEIDILKSNYETCIDAVMRKQAAYNQTDFFIVRNVEADRMRCNSLSNQYNQRIERYNSELSKP